MEKIKKNLSDFGVTLVSALKESHTFPVQELMQVLISLAETLLVR